MRGAGVAWTGHGYWLSAAVRVYIERLVLLTRRVVNSSRMLEEVIGKVEWCLVLGAILIPRMIRRNQIVVQFSRDDHFGWTIYHLPSSTPHITVDHSIVDSTA